MLKEKLKPKFRLVKPEPESTPGVDNKDDEISKLIRSINEMGRKAKAKANGNSKQSDGEPDPPLVA